MGDIYGVNFQTYHRLPPEDQQAVRAGYLRQQGDAAPEASPASEPPPLPTAAQAQSPQEAVQAIHALPLPRTSDLSSSMPSYVYEAIYGPRVQAFNATRAEQAQQALDRFRPELSDFSALNGATASYEYQQSLSAFNSNPYVQELQRIVDESTMQPERVPAYLTGSDNGADTSQLSIEQMSDALGYLGVELPASPTPEQVQAGYQILAATPDDLLAWAVNPGARVSFEAPVAGAGTLTFVPARLNADLRVIGEVELSDVHTGIDFLQTQQFEMSVQMQGTVGASFGKTPLNRLYGWAERLGALPSAATDMINSSPLLRNVVRGLPIPVSGSYEEFAGTRLTYEAVVTPEQGSLLADGDLSATPNPLDPMNMPLGTSMLVRGQTLQGSAFEANYKLLRVGGEQTSLEGQGFGVRRVDENTFEVYSGPVDTVENELFLGLGYRGLGSIGFSADNSLEQQSMSIARIDLRTEEGQAAYQAFMSSGQVPAWSPPGVSQSGTTEILSGEHAARFGVELGGLGWSTELNSSETSIVTTTWADGSAEHTIATRMGDNHHSEISYRLGADGQPVDDDTEYRIVLGNYDSGLASFLSDAYDVAGPSSVDTFDGNQHVQLTFSEAELLQLRDLAREHVGSTEHGAELLEKIEAGSAAASTFDAQLASAETAADVFALISSDTRQFFLAEHLLGLALATETSIPGQIAIRDAG